MTQQTLNESNVDAGLQKLDGGRMAQHVRCDAAGQFGGFAGVANQFTQELGGRRIAARVDQEGGGLWPDALASDQVAFDQGDHARFGQEHPALTIALAVDGDHALKKIDVCDLDRRQFADPHASGQQHFDGDMGGEVVKRHRESRSLNCCR